MKLVEVVILTGMQCISPIQNTSQATIAAKVWCAVMVEKDTAANAIVVTPQAQADDPVVQIVLRRLDPAGPAITQAAPLNTQPTEVVSGLRPSMPVPDVGATAERLQQQAQPDEITPKPVPRPDVTAEVPTDMPAPEAETETSSTAAIDTAPAVEPKTKPDRGKTASASKPKGKKRSSECTGSAKPVWYTNKDGRRKYRCRRAGSGKFY